ncbi:hypothetical protein [Montanilutibacter psychrotolerans]|uniref:Sulfotransferase n=1 Tax=Montanilutibacter psychrotolerans TaxID=1327343 RepID=A0A3M8SYN0_9GAMM|nr:hypothetical protein [Lysobacter psychrotolerans]RNF84364.1 hypothetical protein EER27_08255 [Lysobacter psychrotolerans]
MRPPLRLPGDFSLSAAYPLFALEPAGETALVLHFTADDYRRASFLDRRALAHRDIPGWQPSRDELTQALAGPAAGLPVHWLFHIGHCGSSLLSRLLDLLPGVLGLREPLPLLALAQDPDGAPASPWWPLAVRALDRGFDDTAAVVVKPSSQVACLAAPLLAATSGRACLLWVDLQDWLATMLRDPGLVEAALSGEVARLAGGDRTPAANGIGERLARVWLAAQWRWQRLVDDPALAGRLVDLDFAALLADPAGTTAGLARHFGLPVPTDWDARIRVSGLLDRYAKDPDQAFDAGSRRRELDAAGRTHAHDVAAGLAWAERALANTPDAAITARLRPAAGPGGRSGD